MRKFLALSVLCLIFAAINIAVTPAWAEDAAAPAKADSKPEEKKDADKKPDNTSGGRFSGEPVYVHLDPIVLPIISDTGVEQLVTVLIDIEVKDIIDAATVRTATPRIMDALMTSLYGGLGHGNLRNGKLVDVNKVRVKALAAVQGVVGSDMVQNILIQGVSQRML